MLKGNLFQTPHMKEPVNIDEVAVKILSQASQNVQKLLKIRAEANANGLTHLPVTERIAEVHDNPLHMLYQMALIHELVKAEGPEAVTVAFEESHDGIKKRVFTELLLSKQDLEAAWSRFQEIDKKGQFSLAYSIDTSTSICGDYGTFLFKNFIASQNLAFRCTDASEADKGGYDSDICDLRDDSTLASLRACFGQISPDEIVSLVEPKGLQVRNHHDVEQIKTIKTPYVVKIEGAAHTTGLKNRDFECAHSTSALTKQAGLPFLASIFEKQNFRKISI